MANFPTWINKNKSTTTNNTNLSPRQVANKAYTLAIKKLDKDDKRRKPQYTVRERLLLSNTMAKAENVLNKCTPRFNRRVLACEADDDFLPPAKKITLAPAPAPVASPIPKHEEMLAQATTVQVTPVPQIKNESHIMITSEQQMVVSLAVVAAAYSSLSVAEQQSLISSSSSLDFCRPIMIPTHSNMTTLTTII